MEHRRVRTDDVRSQVKEELEIEQDQHEEAVSSACRLLHAPPWLMTHLASRDWQPSSLSQ